MGKSAIKLVLSQLQVVAPQKGDQGPYVRSRHSVQTSARLRRHQTCVGAELRGKSFSNRDAARRAFAAASAKCRNA